ncbi:hypothetical protein HDU96_002545 [Phlyctochytrium bullatum]|nr:hypothetical protein HDU96_002545 [Phlyctochytrium bullatum]
MLSGRAVEARHVDTNYVAPLPKAHASSMASGWRGTINPNDIKITGCLVANLNCTIEKGLHQNLAVIVKRSTNKNLIEREIDFLDRASKGEFIVAFAGWFEEVELGIMGVVMQKCAMDLKDWADAASSSPPADLDDKMLQISEAIAKGLAFINNQDIIHNDLKPRNVFVDRFNKPYIGDFGVATNRGEALPGYTKQYFDKESLDITPDELSDSWLLGATLWEFWSDEPFNVNERIYLNHIRNNTIKDILKKLLRPRERRPSAGEILSLFDSTTLRSEYHTIVTTRFSAQEQILSPPPRNVSLLQSPILKLDPAAALSAEVAMSGLNVSDARLHRTHTSAQTTDASATSSTGSMETLNPTETLPQTVEVPKTPDHHLIKEGRRGKGILEVLSTERAYVMDLATIHITARKMLQERSIVSDVSFNKIFGGMAWSDRDAEELYVLHGRFLQRMEEMLSPEQWSPEDSSLGNIFLEFEEDITKNYLIYISNYSEAKRQISHEETHNPKFKKFLVDCRESSQIKRDFKDLLVLPMRRLTKYSMMIRWNQKNTPKEHPEWSILGSAFEVMSNVVTTVNNKMVENEKLILLFTAFDETLNCPSTLLLPHRRFRMSIDAVDVATGKPIHLFLCSDLLMVVTVVTMQTNLFRQNQCKYKFSRWLDLLECSAEEIQNDVVRITLSEKPRQGSLTTPGSPRVNEYKISNWLSGKLHFMRSLFQEIERVRSETV